MGHRNPWSGQLDLQFGCDRLFVFGVATKAVESGEPCVLDNVIESGPVLIDALPICHPRLGRCESLFGMSSWRHSRTQMYVQ